MNINEHDPAFPTEDDDNFYHGITVRDYFAAKVIQGLLSDIPKSMYGTGWKETLVEAAYEIADLMMKEREK